MKKSIWLIVGIVIVVIIIIVATNAGKAPSQAGPIKIGVIAPLTGDAAIYGEPGVKVYQLAVDEINANGGINGRKVALIVQDGKCTGEGAANAAQKLVNVDRVQVIIGGFCSGESLSTIPVAEPAHVAVF